MSATLPHPPAIVDGMPFGEYLALPRVSSHGLMQIERSPRHYRQSLDTPHAPSAAQQLGTATHLAILEPDEFHRRARISPDVDRRTRAGKEAVAAFEAELPADALILATEQHARIQGMREAVMAQPFARALLADGRAETTLLAEIDGTPIKARADWLCDSHEVIVDLKTAADASEPVFRKSAGNWKYHIQNAFYIDAAKLAGLGERAFVFIVVESDPPHGVALYQMSEEAIRVGRIRYQRALETYRQCVAAGEWPSYPCEIQTLDIPKWAL